MNKQRIAYLLGLVWLFGLSIDFLTQSKADTGRSWAAGLEIVQKSNVQVSDIPVYIDSPKTSVTVDWSLWFKFKSQWISLKYSVKGASDCYLFTKKAIALFDVKETFAHFFHPG